MKREELHKIAKEASDLSKAIKDYDERISKLDTLMETKSQLVLRIRNSGNSDSVETSLYRSEPADKDLLETVHIMLIQRRNLLVNELDELLNGRINKIKEVLDNE